MVSRCCGDTCLCKLLEGDDDAGNDSISITGTGTQADPFRIAFRGLAVTDSTDIDLSLTYNSTDGYHLTAAFAVGSKLDHLGDVNAPAPTNGQVLSWDTATSKWVAVPATTAAPGAVMTDNSLTGDGSIGSPLAAVEDPDGYLETGASGMKLTDDGINSLVRHYADDADRSTTTPAPVLNSLSVLDTGPGQVDYWDGSDWQPLALLSVIDSVEYLALSGSYDGRPVTLWTRVKSVTTDLSGSFEAITTAELSGAAGVLSVTVQPLGDLSSTPWLSYLNAPIGTNVLCSAYATDGSGLLSSTALQCLVVAYLY